MAAEPVAAAAADDALAGLVGDPVAFVDEHFGRAPLLCRGAQTGTAPLTVDDVDALLTGGGLRWPAFRLVEQGRTVPRSEHTRAGTIGGQRVDDLADVGRTLARFDEGATLVLQGLHRYHPPVADLCAGLHRALGHPVQANAYLTPPGSRGLDVHHDTHDVLALQVHGHKHWVVHEPAVELPLPSQPWSSSTHEPGPLVLDTDLGPGDLLYLPRGTPHAAETVTGVSLHLTLGIRVVTWYDVVQRAVRRLADDVTLREALPVGFDREPERLAEELERRLAAAAKGLGEVDAAGLVEEVRGARRRARRVDLRGALRELVDLERIDDETMVVRRTDLEADLEEQGDRMTLVLPDRRVELPAAAGPVVAELLDGARHRVGELADRVDTTGRLVLVRRLVREGALVTTPDAAGG
jgi:bifunctional lysine-specific demethylase and histidyl-hydroxylase NO66